MAGRLLTLLADVSSGLLFDSSMFSLAREYVYIAFHLTHIAGRRGILIGRAIHYN
jgi:hypothetical protein